MDDLAYFVDTFGRPLSVPSNQTATALALGYIPASPEQIDDYKKARALHEKYRTPAQGAIATAEGLGSGATLGLTDLIETQLGLTTPEAMRGRSEAWPTLQPAAKFTGAVAPAILSGVMGPAGPTTVLGKTVASLPSALAVRAGMAAARPVTQAVSGGAARTMAQQILARGAGEVVSGAVQGGLFTAGDLLSEAALGDANITAQSALAHIGLGAALGGGLGGLLGAGSVAVPAAIDKARDVLNPLFQSARNWGLDQYLDYASKRGANRATVEFLFQHKPELLELQKMNAEVARRLPFVGVDSARLILTDMKKAFTDTTVRSEMQTAMRTAMEDGVEAVEAASKTFNASIKPTVFETMLQGVPPEAARKQASAVLAETAARVAKYESDPGLWDHSIAVKLREQLNSMAQAVLPDTTAAQGRLLNIIDAVAAEPELAPYGKPLQTVLAKLQSFEPEPKIAAQALGTVWSEMATNTVGFDPILKEIERTAKQLLRVNEPSAADIFNRLDTAKNAIWKIQSRVLGNTQQALETKPDVISLWGMIKAGLEDQAVYGEAGAKQAYLNEAIHEYLQARDAMRGEFFIKKVSLDEPGKEWRVNPNKINSFFHQAHDDRAMFKNEYQDAFDARARTLLDRMEEIHRIAPVTTWDKTAVTAALNNQARMIAEARQQAAVTSLMNQLDPKRNPYWGSQPIAHTDVLGGMQRGIEMGKAGAGLSAALGASAIGLPSVVSGLGVAYSALKAAQVLNNLAHDPTAVVSTLATLQKVKDTMEGVIASGASAVVRGAKTTWSAGGAGLASASLASAAERKYRERTSEVQSTINSPDKLMAALEKVGVIAPHAPATSQAAQTTVARALAFLGAAVPSTPSLGVFGDKWTPSGTEIAAFNEKYDAVHEPLSILKDAQNGTLTPAKVSAVATVYPELFRQIQIALMTALAAHPSPPYRARVMLSILLGADLDGSLNPVTLTANQAAFQMPSTRPDMVNMMAPPTGQKSQAARPPTVKGMSRMSLSTRTLTPSQSALNRQHKS